MDFASVIKTVWSAERRGFKAPTLSTSTTKHTFESITEMQGDFWQSQHDQPVLQARTGKARGERAQQGPGRHPGLQGWK